MWNSQKQVVNIRRYMSLPCTRGCDLCVCCRGGGWGKVDWIYIECIGLVHAGCCDSRLWRLQGSAIRLWWLTPYKQCHQSSTLINQSHIDTDFDLHWQFAEDTLEILKFDSIKMSSFLLQNMDMWEENFGKSSLLTVVLGLWEAVCGSGVTTSADSSCSRCACATGLLLLLLLE